MTAGMCSLNISFFSKLKDLFSFSVSLEYQHSVLIAACDDGALWRLDCDDPKPK
jgi:hypothetical protein